MKTFFKITLACLTFAFAAWFTAPAWPHCKLKGYLAYSGALQQQYFKHLDELNHAKELQHASH